MRVKNEAILYTYMDVTLRFGPQTSWPKLSAYPFLMWCALVITMPYVIFHDQVLQEPLVDLTITTKESQLIHQTLTFTMTATKLQVLLFGKCFPFSPLVWIWIQDVHFTLFLVSLFV